MYPKAILPIALIALTLSAHATPINTQRTNLKEISNLLRKRGATENAEAEAGNPLSAISGLLGGAGGAAGGDLLNNLPIKRDVAKRAPLDLSDITGAIGGAGAKGDAAAAGDADAGNPLSAISGLLGGAGGAAGGAAGGDLLNNLPIKRDNIRREPLPEVLDGSLMIGVKSSKFLGSQFSVASASKVLGASGSFSAGGSLGPLGPSGSVSAGGSVSPFGASGGVAAGGSLGPLGPSGSVSAEGSVSPFGASGGVGAGGSLGPLGPSGSVGANGSIGA